MNSHMNDLEIPGRSPAIICPFVYCSWDVLGLSHPLSQKYGLEKKIAGRARQNGDVMQYHQERMIQNESRRPPGRWE